MVNREYLETGNFSRDKLLIIDYKLFFDPLLKLSFYIFTIHH